MSNRFSDLKESKYLGKRIFSKLSENMHYEVFKFLSSDDLLSIRALKLGGYQLISNSLLRARIKNYLLIRPRSYISKMESEKLAQNIALIVEQTGEKNLNYNYFNIGNEAIVSMANILHKVSLITEMHLRGNKIKKSGAYELTYNLKFIKDLRILDLRTNDLGDSGIESLSLNLNFTPNLNTLDLGVNWFGDQGAIKLASNLKLIPNLEKLNLFGNLIEQNGVDEIASNFKFVPKMKKFVIGSNWLDNSGGKLIAENLKFIRNLESLDLSGKYARKIGNITAIALLNNLQYVPRLQKLDLSHNQIEKSIQKQLTDLASFKFLPICVAILCILIVIAILVWVTRSSGRIIKCCKICQRIFCCCCCLRPQTVKVQNLNISTPNTSQRLDNNMNISRKLTPNTNQRNVEGGSSSRNIIPTQDDDYESNSDEPERICHKFVKEELLKKQLQTRTKHKKRKKTIVNNAGIKEKTAKNALIVLHRDLPARQGILIKQNVQNAPVLFMPRMGNANKSDEELEKQKKSKKINKKRRHGSDELGRCEKIGEEGRMKYKIKIRRKSSSPEIIYYKRGDDIENSSFGSINPPTSPQVLNKLEMNAGVVGELPGQIINAHENYK